MPMISKLNSIDVCKLKEIVDESYNITEVLRKIGYTNPRAKSTRDRLKRILEENNIDTSHLDQYRGRKNASHNQKYSIEELLVENSHYSRSALKSRLINEGLLEYKCVKCGNTGEWMGKKLVLQLDHRNGISNDNRLDNLRILCPNCHSQTNTFSGKSSRR